MRIRPYEPRDLDAVVGIFRSNIPKYFSPSEEPELLGFLQDCVSDYYVVEVDDEIFGAGGIALNADIDPQTVSLCWGMVCADHLGTGLGRALTEFRIKLAQEKYPSIALTIGTSQHTEGFYRKFGFITVEHTPDGYGPGVDMCRMLLEIGK